MIYFVYLVIYLIAELCVENYSALVYPDENGRLVYQADSQGNVIPDFSNCGYKGGGVALPNVPVVRTVWPQVEGDDTARLQAAINEVSMLTPDSNGFRGALLLKRGEYRVEGRLSIRTSGVVLRGEGDGVNGTVIIATGTSDRTLIRFLGIGNPVKVAGTRQAIVDDYVPVGARTFEVENGSGFAEDDSVIVHRPGTQEWIEELEMDDLDDPWQAVKYNLLFDRVVTKVEGNFVTLDAPLGNSLDHNYGGGWIYKYTFTGRIEKVGIENIRGVSEYDDSVTDSNGNFIHIDHADGFVDFVDVKNGWARNLTGAHFSYSCVSIKESKWVTVQDVQHLEPVSPIVGGERYAFVLDGSPRDVNSQLILFQRCYSLKGRHSFVLQGRIQGPNAFVDCVSDEPYSDEGPHRHWSTAALYDNVRGIVGNNNAKINVRNRGDWGTGHGWAGANMVLWNCDVNTMIVQKPPTAQNYAIGCKGVITAGSEPDGYWESNGTHVYPRSLYYKQLEDRLGMDAVRAVATNEQIGRLMASKRVQGKIGQVQQGDFNGDGCIGFSDFLAFASHYGLREGQTRYNARYDLDGDKSIGFGDFLIFAANFG
ncbi:MAG: hypothetical protein J4F29_21265 [Candidatus Latescibacteria bacterium]|nr:hypothetical protein [Candidatus Latescibacterota bacterium]